MKQQIDNLIANLLLDEGEVALPEVGTLILRREPAKFLSKKQLQRPYRELRFTKEQRGVSLCDHIARLTQVSDERARDIYAEWLSQSLRNEILTINNLCIVEGGKVSTDKTFEDMANPKGRGTVKINPRTNYLIYIMAGLCIGFALGVATYVLHTNGMLGNLLAKRNIAPASSAFENVAEVAEPTAIATEEVVAIADNSADSTVVSTIAETPQPAVEEVVAPSEPIITSVEKGKSYAVWGVYNELKNAEDAIAWLNTRIPEIDSAKIYLYDSRYMVALCEVGSRSECGRKVSAWKAQHKSCKSVWVYTR